MKIRAVLFDKDGTLFDFNATYGQAGRELLRDLSGGDAELLTELETLAGIDARSGHFRNDSIIFANATEQFAPTLAERIDVVCDDHFLQRIDTIFEKYSIEHITPFETSRPLLDRLSETGYLLGCVTNDAESCARAQFAATDFSSYFVEIIGYDSGHGAKPQPGQLEAFAAKHDLRCDEIAYVGDSLHDMHAARAAGSMAIAVTTGMHDAAVLSPHADHVVDSLGEIPGLLVDFG